MGESGSLLPHFIKLSLLLDCEDFVDFGLQAGVRDHKWLQDAGLLRREFAHLTNIELPFQSGRDEFPTIVRELFDQRSHLA